MLLLLNRNTVGHKYSRIIFLRFERWTKSERNQTVASMSFKKTLKESQIILSAF